MKQQWEIDKARADKYLPNVKAVMGLLFSSETTKEEDCLENSDLKIFTVKNNMKVAWRHRHTDYLEFFKYEVTFRSKRPNGTKTELQKIKEGFGDYFLYSCVENDSFLCVAIDLDKFRNLEKEDAPREIKNQDGSSSFVVLPYRNDKGYPKSFVMAMIRDLKVHWITH